MSYYEQPAGAERAPLEISGIQSIAHESQQQPIHGFVVDDQTGTYALFTERAELTLDNERYAAASLRRPDVSMIDYLIATARDNGAGSALAEEIVAAATEASQTWPEWSEYAALRYGKQLFQDIHEALLTAGGTRPQDVTGAMVQLYHKRHKPRGSEATSVEPHMLVVNSGNVLVFQARPGDELSPAGYFGAVTVAHTAQTFRTRARLKALEQQQTLSEHAVKPYSIITRDPDLERQILARYNVFGFLGDIAVKEPRINCISLPVSPGDRLLIASPDVIYRLSEREVAELLFRGYGPQDTAFGIANAAWSRHPYDERYSDATSPRVSTSTIVVDVPQPLDW